MARATRKPKRLYGDKRVRTRAELVRAATAIIAKKGFMGATLADIARRARMTKGAIYGNFANKEDLFLAVIEREQIHLTMRLTPGAPFKSQMRALGRAVVSMANAARPLAALSVELELYALTHEPMRRRLEGHYRRLNDQTAAMLGQTIRPEDLPAPPQQFAALINAMIGGLLHQRYLAPDLTTDAAIVAAFERLAR